jgi:hypothetical protein
MAGTRLRSHLALLPLVHRHVLNNDLTRTDATLITVAFFTNLLDLSNWLY